MDAIELLRYQVRQTWDWLDMTMSDVTEEEANWQPSGIANSIADDLRAHDHCRRRGLQQGVRWRSYAADDHLERTMRA